MEREVARILPYLLIGMFVLGVLTLLIALQQLRVRRTGAYWLLRRRAGERGGRLFLIAVGLIVLSLVLTVVSGLAAVAVRNMNSLINRNSDDLYGIVLPSESALTETWNAAMQAFTATHAYQQTMTLTPQVAAATAVLPTNPPPTPVPPASAAPSLTPTAIPPTVSPTDAPTITPSLTPVAWLNLTPDFNATPRPPSAGFSLTLITADTSVNPNGSPLSPRQHFTAGVKRIYFFINFAHMENGVAWSRVLYRDGSAVQGNTLLWSLGSDGSSYFFFGDEAGYSSGNYEVRIFVDAQQVSQLQIDVSAD